MKKVKVGIVGVGNMGSGHAREILGGAIENMELAAICDINEQKLPPHVQDFSGIPSFSDYRELIKSGLCEAIIIATPHYKHPEIAIYAFEQGLHVLTEKPAGVYTEAVKEMNAAAKTSGKVFGIMYNQRTTPIFAKARSLVREGKLGQLKRVVWIITNWYRNQAYYDSGDWRATWAGEGGGVLLNQCVHNIDIWQWIVGMPCEIRGFCEYGKYHNIEVEDDVSVFARYPGGATGVFITSTGEYPGTNRLEIAGDLGKLVLEGGVLKFWEFDRSERDYCFNSDNKTPKPKIEYREIEFKERGTAHNGILRDFASAILTGSELLSPGEEGINALEIINAIFLSDWQDKTITLPVDSAEYKKLLDEKIKTSQPRQAQSQAPAVADKGARDRWAVKW